jgi:hypothetical protein
MTDRSGRQTQIGILVIDIELESNLEKHGLRKSLVYWIMNGHGMKITIVEEIGQMLHL